MQVWRIGLDVSEIALARYRAVLDDEELGRADRFYRPIHRARFAAGRGILRMLLGGCLGVPPGALRFEYGPQGKPRLSGESNPLGVSFNLSHSGDAALCAISRFDTVGVDIEACRESRDLLPIARRFFSEDERRQLASLPRDQQSAAFYQGWTCKEALLKAWGTGLRTPLDRFTVSLQPGEIRLVSLDLPTFAAIPWQLHALAAPVGFSAALAIPGPIRRLQNWQWPSDANTVA